jgi:RimJ/RimL family protein N-acetyltransferase
MNPEEVIRYSENENPFSDINVIISDNELTPEIKKLLYGIIIPNVTQKNKDPFFNSMWLAIEKRFLVSVGSLIFKGSPDKEGMVEIGYGANEEYRDRGYITEAVEALCSAAFETGRVNRIIAETAKDNVPSFSVLEKNNFTKFKENKDFYYWEKLKNG